MKWFGFILAVLLFLFLAGCSTALKNEAVRECRKDYSPRIDICYELFAKGTDIDEIGYRKCTSEADRMLVKCITDYY